MSRYLPEAARSSTRGVADLIVLGPSGSRRAQAGARIREIRRQLAGEPVRVELVDCPPAGRRCHRPGAGTDRPCRRPAPSAGRRPAPLGPAGVPRPPAGRLGIGWRHHDRVRPVRHRDRACALGWTEAGIVDVNLPEAGPDATRRRIAGRLAGSREQPPPPAVRAAMARIVALFDGAADDLADVELDLSGVPDFHRDVYRVTRGIRPGKTLSYGAIAAELRLPGAARAVGRALGHNPCPIIVPCHRVLAADGSMHGFSATAGWPPSAGCCRPKVRCRPTSRRCSEHDARAPGSGAMSDRCSDLRKRPGRVQQRGGAADRRPAGAGRRGGVQLRRAGRAAALQSRRRRRAAAGRRGPVAPAAGRGRRAAVQHPGVCRRAAGLAEEPAGLVGRRRRDVRQAGGLDQLLVGRSDRGGRRLRRAADGADLRRRRDRRAGLRAGAGDPRRRRPGRAGDRPGGPATGWPRRWRRWSLPPGRADQPRDADRRGGPVGAARSIDSGAPGPVAARAAAAQPAGRARRCGAAASR